MSAKLKPEDGRQGLSFVLHIFQHGNVRGWANDFTTFWADTTA